MKALKLLAIGLGVLVLASLGLFWLAYFSARPPLATEPHVLLGDGSTVDYCQLPTLDGSGKQAANIPKGNTPGCSYAHFPLPILGDCTEPLVDGASDMRGLWVGVSGRVGHIERIEQCGARTVVTSSGVIHDSGPNSSGRFTTDDTAGSVLFTIGGREYCPRSSAGMTWQDGVLEFRIFGWGPVVVRRYLEGDQLVWEYADGIVTRMERICRLPQEHRVPAPRGARYALWK